MAAFSSTACTVGLFVAPAVTFRQVFHNRSAGDLSWLPFWLQLLNCICWFSYGLAIANGVVLWLNSLGFVLSVEYLFVFFYVAPQPERLRMARYLVPGVGLELALIVAVAAFAPGRLQGVTGLGGTLVSGCMYVSPLLQLSLIFRERSTAALSLPWCLAAFANNLSWTVYSLLLGDMWMLVPSAIGLALTTFQLALFAIFPSSKPSHHVPSSN